MGSLTFNPLTLASFNGSSQFAGDLQNMINHAVNVAAIPLTQLGNDANALNNQKTELSTLLDKFTAIQTSLKSLGTANSGSFVATGTDDSVASFSLESSAATGSGSYTLDVLNAGLHTRTLSNAGATVADPSLTSLSTSTSFTLSVNGVNTTITPAANTLSSLAQAINSSGAGVSAVIVNLGSPGTPDYRLSLQGTALHDDAIQLNDGSGDLLQTLTHGTEATYQVDGQPTTPISTTSSTVTLAPGLTANLLHTGTTDIEVASDPTAAEDALTAFATAYNAAIAEIGRNHGTVGGPLTGEAVLTQLEQTLRGLVQYSGGSGTVTSLSDIGLTFDPTGKLTFNQLTFDNARTTHPQDVSAFLGSAGSPGFLATADATLTNLADPISGLFKTTSDSLQKRIDQDTDQINITEKRITTMQAAMVQQMSLADAALATMESQLTMLTGLFQATRDAVNNNK
jgi:flagellar hook-associated protein 2